MKADEPLAGPVIRSAWQPDPAGQAWPADVGTVALAALPTSPFRARRYTRSFLDSCPGISADVTGTAELIVSELVTNAVRSGGGPDASLIVLSLWNFREVLLIEVYDADRTPPILSSAADHAENGRGLMLVDALSKEWSYFFPPCGGKVVYCVLEKEDPLPQVPSGSPESQRNPRARRRCEYPANR
jgi:anti-sigma regulatory factor (Ser/Thr protein kinase)